MSMIVIMPGGFHPFHAGHYSLYNDAKKAFPGADLYVAATNDQSERPFPFSLKEKLAKLAGVEPGHFIQVKSPFQAREITQNYDPNKDVLVFVRSEKDRNEQPKPGGTKKDGSPAYFQPWTGKNLQPFSKHAYIEYLPTVEFGPGITSATQIRKAWPTLDDRRKTAMVMSLYPAAQKNTKLAQTVVGMFDQVMGGQLNEFAPGNGDDGLPYAEYVVYQCDPNDQFEFIGGPLYQTDNLGMAHKYAYEHFLRYRPKAFVVYQPHKEASRGNYGVKGESDEEVAEDLTRRDLLTKAGVVSGALALGVAADLLTRGPSININGVEYKPASMSRSERGAEVQTVKLKNGDIVKIWSLDRKGGNTGEKVIHLYRKVEQETLDEGLGDYITKKIDDFLDIPKISPQQISKLMRQAPQNLPDDVAEKLVAKFMETEKAKRLAQQAADAKKTTVEKIVPYLTYFGRMFVDRWKQIPQKDRDNALKNLVHNIGRFLLFILEVLAKGLMKKESIEEETEDLSYIGNCTDDDVIEYIFGDATNFAQAVEEHGDEFTIDDLVVKYDPETDVHSFYYKKQGVAEAKSKAIAQTAKDLENPPKVMQHRAKRDMERDTQLKGRDIAKRDDDEMFIPGDTEGEQLLRYVRQHYPGATTKQQAFIKFAQRALKHSEEEDTKQDQEISQLQKDVSQIKQLVNKNKVAESTDYLDEK